MAAGLALFIAAALLAAAAAPAVQAATTYGPGYQPNPKGAAQKCPKGTYKGYSGAYKCKACPKGSIAPGTGRRTCIKCTPTSKKTSNSGRTFCVYKPGVPTPAPTVTPTPQPTRSFKATIKAQSGIYYPSFPCHSDIGGATRCGIPVGYTDNNRTGAIWLPRTYRNNYIPYMILLHGSGFTGDRMIDTFKNTANQWQYGIIAPDSREPLYWEVPSTGKSTWTHDFYHIQACWDWVIAKQPGVKVNSKFIMIVGNSRAAYAAAAFGSRTTIGINACLLIHAAADPHQMGYRKFPIYWSTGYSDPLYGPKNANYLRSKFKKEQPGYPITYRVWQGSHTIRNYTELADWSKWWLVPSDRKYPAPPLFGR